MSDLRTTMERGVGQATPPPDGYGRMLRRRDRKRRNQRIAAGVVAIAVFAAPVWIVASGGRADRATTPAATAPPTPDQVGLIGLAPKGATPSTPARGNLVLSFGFGHTDGDAGGFSVFVYADGRMIWRRLGAPAFLTTEEPSASTGLLEQRLTPEGVGRVRAEVLSTGLAAHDLHLTSHYGLHSGQLEVSIRGKLVSVTWGDQSLDDVGGGQVTTEEQARALQLLDARLEDPASWLPASAWADEEIKPFVPSGYSVCYDAHGVGFSRVLSSLPRRAEDMLRAWDTTHEVFPEGTGPARDVWCSEATSDEARSLAQILDGADVQKRYEDVFGLRYVMPRATGVTVSIDPLLPHEISRDAIG